jgi:competence protein ComEA
VLKCRSRRRSFDHVIDRRKAEVAAYALAAFVVVLVAFKLLHRDGAGGSGGTPVTVTEPRAPGSAGTNATGPAAVPSGPEGAPAARLLVVDVAGEVRRPGVYRVPTGSRVDSAVQQAGGVTRRGEPAAVNLAMPLHDGQQIIVPRRGSPAPAAASGSGSGAGAGSVGGAAPAGSAPAQPVSLSTATVEQLDSLDGIGPTLAARIVQYRDAHGGFRSVDELRQVSGIGDKRFEALRKAVQP